MKSNLSSFLLKTTTLATLVLCTLSPTANAEEILVEDNFADASIYQRDLKVVPKAIDWFSRSPSPLELVVGDEVLGAGYAVKVHSPKAKDSPPAVVGHFPMTCLEKTGDYLELSFDYRANVHADNANSFFVFGLFNDQENPTKEDKNDSSDSYPGYAASISADGKPDRKPAQSFLLFGPQTRARLTATGERFKFRQDELPALEDANLNNKFHFRFRITKAADNTAELTAEFSDVTGSQTTELSALVTTDKLVSLNKSADGKMCFNTIGLGNTIDRVTAFTFTNLRLSKGSK